MKTFRNIVQYSLKTQFLSAWILNVTKLYYILHILVELQANWI